MYKNKNIARRNPEPFKKLFNTKTKAWNKLSEQSQLNRQELKRIIYGKIQ